MTWLVYAFISAASAAATAVLAKRGVEGVPSTLATAVRTLVVVVFVWLMVVGLNQHRDLRTLTARTWMYLALSGIGTGVSWLAYFHALKLGPASRVAPIDKLSVAFAIALGVLVLGEPFSWRIALGGALVVAGALVIATG